MPSATVLLFVYGSLKRGGRHHEELAGAPFVGPAETEPGYRLEALAGTEYLALVPAPSGAAPSTVTGELFLVEESRLPALDAFEGDGYRRAEVKIGKGVFALAYLKNAD
jgi:gamma-glutamylaminecyclotransferase